VNYEIVHHADTLVVGRSFQMLQQVILQTAININNHKNKKEIGLVVTVKRSTTETPI
jgi:hypothetical protein